MAATAHRPWHVYLVECADGTLYCGITNDVPRRIAAHNAGRGARYTRGRAPVRLVWTEEAGDRPAALRREHQVKQMPRAAKAQLARNESPNRRGRPPDPAAPPTHAPRIR